jgi:arylsulfotransferase ASST/carbohydrate binding protein with CBM4/9 domain/type IX secretion system substrate protein
VKNTGLLFIFCWLFASTSLAQVAWPDGYQYLFPGPGARGVYPNSTLILRFEIISPEDVTNLERFILVSGDISGSHTGEILVAADGRTVIFTPEKPFESGEKVEVSLYPRLTADHAHMEGPISYNFTVLEEALLNKKQLDQESLSTPEKEDPAASYYPRIMSNGVSVPSDFPDVEVTIHQNPSEDYVFLNTRYPPNYSIIFNTAGEPVWYWKTPDRRDDFKVQSNGWITMFVEDGYGGNGPGFIALDQNFEFIKSMRAVNGYTTDEHDFLLLPDGSYILIGNRTSTVDMTQYVSGGRTNAQIVETCIQEFNAEDQLIFIWRSWDHFDIRNLELDVLTGSRIRFPHINAIYEDDDGHILLSSRHLSEISKIHRQSGEFIWRMSGIPDSPNNDFQFENDPLKGFRNQHAIRSLGNNAYTLFDNGNGHLPPVSRALEYVIDTTSKTATLVWDYRSAFKQGFVGHMGNSQKLSNGNTHINWVYGNVLPIATEVTPAGTRIFEMWFTNGERCYRSFRHPWEGICQTPYLLLEPQADNLTLIFNKFGDNEVDYYRIYGGTSPNPTSLTDTSRATLKKLADLPKGQHYYFRVTAVDKLGVESAYSNEEDVILRDTGPGANLIVNGDFSRALEEWESEVDSTTSAEVKVMDSICHFLIQDGGNSYSNVQLKQMDIPLFPGETYLFEFDAWASEARLIEIIIGEFDSPYGDYSLLGYTALDKERKHYSYTFEMKNPPDLNACLRILAGGSGDLYLDNISLKMELPSNVADPSMADDEFKLYPNYPNPFHRETRIEYFLPEPGSVKLTIYNVLGQKMEAFSLAGQAAGKHSWKIQLPNANPGIYFYSLEAEAKHSVRHYHKTNRMILLKQ